MWVELIGVLLDIILSAFTFNWGKSKGAKNSSLFYGYSHMHKCHSLSTFF